MILCHVKQADRWSAVHPGFAAAFAFLRQENLHCLSGGRHEIDGERMYAVVHRVTETEHVEVKLEAHRKYIDVHLSVLGTDLVGWKSTSDCRQTEQSYNPEIDAEYFGDTPDFWLPMPPGTLAVFFPEDAHAPQAGKPPLVKVVVKVAV